MAWSGGAGMASSHQSLVGRSLWDVRLGKYNPLSRILYFDDFDEGMNGWCELVGNHTGDLDQIRPIAKDFRPPQLSSCTFFDIGTHGSVDGTYSLKLATRPQRNHLAIAIKRMTYAARGLVQFETYVTFKSELIPLGERALQSEDGPRWDGNVAPSARHFGEFTFSNDICVGETGPRCHGVVRYRNADPAGNLVQKWVYPTSVEPTTKMDRLGLVASDTRPDFFAVSPADWREIPGGRQPLCFNETASKVNWHYVRWLFDLESLRTLEFQCNDLCMDMRDVAVPTHDEEYRGIPNLLNLYVAVRTHVNVRNFLYLDSALVSVDW